MLNSSCSSLFPDLYDVEEEEECKYFALKFWISVKTLSLVNGFTSYSLMLLRSIPFHQHVAW